MHRCVVLLSSAIVAMASATQPNPPVWPSTVQVFNSSSPIADIEAVVNAAFAENGGHEPANHGQFSSSRYAFLFEPGTYAVDVPVGFYTQVLGLGDSPGDVVFTGELGVYCEEGEFDETGSLDTFWRGAENFRTSSAHTWTTGTGMMWAVSQAAALRRIDVDNDLVLFEYQPPFGGAGEASGGFVGNSRIKGTVQSGSQQQFLSRNCALEGGWSNGVWNMVFVGSSGAPASHCGNNGDNSGNPYTTVEETPTVAEKPFLSVGMDGRYHLNVPQLRTNAVGPAWLDSKATDKRIGFENVYVTDPAKDTAASMNKALSDGLHLVISPGIYSLDASLEVTHPNQVVLGLGLATLIAANGQPCITVADIDGARVAGVLLQAGEKPTSALLRWGTGGYAGNAENPGVMSDVNARVGGSDKAEVQVETMVEVNSGHVIGDNFWLWRADHDVSGLVKAGRNPVANALRSKGDDFTMYGLKAEHSLEDLVVFEGERGRTFFFQAELPYDVDEAYAKSGYTGYRVADNVKEHEAYGVGVYHFFRDYPVEVESGIVVPEALEGAFVHPLGVFLNGMGKVNHVLNELGNATEHSDTVPGAIVEYVCPN